MQTLIHDAELPLTWQDCLEFIDMDKFIFHRTTGQRIGQAWMNSLYSGGDYIKLTNSYYDPFYHDSKLSVIQALMFLLEN